MKSENLKSDKYDTKPLYTIIIITIMAGLLNIFALGITVGLAASQKGNEQTAPTDLPEQQPVLSKLARYDGEQRNQYTPQPFVINSKNIDKGIKVINSLDYNHTYNHNIRKGSDGEFHGVVNFKSRNGTVKSLTCDSTYECDYLRNAWTEKFVGKGNNPRYEA